MRPSPSLRCVALFLPLALMSACDTDMYFDTKACRDDDPNTVCPIDGSTDSNEASKADQNSAQAGEERWIAGSRTATSITGDILLSPQRLRFEGIDIPLKFVADVPRFGGYAGPVAARVLAVTPPTNPELLNGNTFGCGKPVQWIAVWQFENGKQLAMTVFDDPQMPTSEKSPGFCASYYYLRP